MAQLMLGNAAVALGLRDAGCRLVSSYPGTPSTEITENAVKYDSVYCEWAPNEKVAVETAAGASLAGARAFAAQKHVGLNVAADPLYTMSYIGVNGGLVIAVADDPGMHSSQNEQDSRHHAEGSKIMMLEPSNSQECYDFTKLAFSLSEEFDTPVLLRLTTRVAHSTSLVESVNDGSVELREYVKNPQKNVMMPAMAKVRHVFVEERIKKQIAWAENCPVNKIEWNSKRIGVIAAGITYQYAKEALGAQASYLKLGCVYPLPVELIKTFVASCDEVYVLEQLDPVIERHCKALGLSVIGKEKFTLCGEYSQSMIKKVILGEENTSLSADISVPGRPPVLCAGCPHRGLFNALKEIDANIFVSGDIGCYTLGSLAPIGMMDTCICMGASVSSLHGRNKVRPEGASRSVAILGDSTFIHSGITGLINIAYNQTNSKVIVLDNSITGMTGHQQNPTTGKRINGDPTAAVDLEALAHACGINRVLVVDPYDIPATKAALLEELDVEAPSLIISRRPCALLKGVKHNPPFKVDAEKCAGCKACMKIGCPAISIKDNKSQIDFTQCVGCGMCKPYCHVDAIKEGV